MACKATSYQASGEIVTPCLPSRLSRVRASSPACVLCIVSLGRLPESLHPKWLWRVFPERRSCFWRGGCSDILFRLWAPLCLVQRKSLPQIRVSLTNILLWSGWNTLPLQKRVICLLSSLHHAKVLRATHDLPVGYPRPTCGLPTLSRYSGISICVNEQLVMYLKEVLYSWLQKG